jgi:beta-glucanase (GH16 family)
VDWLRLLLTSVIDMTLNWIAALRASTMAMAIGALFTGCGGGAADDAQEPTSRTASTTGTTASAASTTASTTSTNTVLPGSPGWASDLLPHPTLAIALPVQAPGPTCAAVSGGASATNTVAATQSFHDPFDTFDLSTRRWLPYFDGGYDVASGTYLGATWGLAKRTLSGTGEEEIYVDSSYAGTGTTPLGLNPFTIKDGVLNITANRIPDAMQPLLYDRKYYSGVLTTRASLVQRYGFFEMRARVPAGQGLWPAFWMIAADKQWPPEIDVLEVVGGQPTQMVTTTHSANATGGDVPSGCRTTLADATTKFHNFGMLWTPERIVYYIDRVPVAQLATPAGVDKPMYMLLNLAIGGRMAGPPDATTPFPSSFEIDWVSAYSLPGHAPCDPRRSAADIDACVAP